MIHATIKLETECPGRTETQQVELVCVCLEMSKMYSLYCSKDIIKDMQKFNSWKIEGGRYPRKKTRNTRDTGAQKQYQVGES